MSKSRKFRLFALSILLAGCGSSDSSFVVTQTSGAPPATVSALIDETGGSLTNPVTGHSATLAPQALDDQTNVTLTLLSSDGLTPRNDTEFDPVGTAMSLRVPGGLSGTVSLTVPYSTNNAAHHRLYWRLPNGVLFPLESSYNPANGTFTASLDLTEARILAQAAGQTSPPAHPEDLTVTVVDESIFDARPPHVPWPSYNLYYFQNGAFTKIVDQGILPTPPSTLPAPGDHPLMIVHGLGSDASRFNKAAAFFQKNGTFSSIYAFEYDTQVGLTTTGPKLVQAYDAVEDDPTRHWSHVAHSMGTLISRVAFETGGPPPIRQQ